LPARNVPVTAADLTETWAELSGATTPEVDLVSLGNPHFSLSEIARLAALCQGRHRAPGTALVVTCGRDIFAQAQAAGHVAKVRAFGGTFLNDTCWCLVTEPVVSPQTRGVVTNSGKYAHYGAAALGKPFHFASLAGCVQAAETGLCAPGLPGWLG
jgi:predicted aconitase